jgi:hypothetical protein
MHGKRAAKYPLSRVALLACWIVRIPQAFPYSVTQASLLYEETLKFSTLHCFRSMDGFYYTVS